VPLFLHFQELFLQFCRIGGLYHKAFTAAI
jgi:hypothetical protein